MTDETQTTQPVDELLESEDITPEEQPDSETPEQAETSATEAQDEGGNDPEEGSGTGKKGGFQRKLDKLSAENTKLKQQLQALAGSQDADQEAKPKPVADNYDSYDDYLADLAEWHVGNKTRAQVAEYREHLVRAEGEERVAKFKAASAEFHKTTPDYLDVLKTVDDITVPPAVQQVLLAVDNAPALMYALAKDRSQLESLAGLPLMQAALLIGSLSADLKAQAKRGPQVSNAKPPIRPVGSSSTAPSRRPEDMSMSEYRAWRNSQ